MEFRVIAMPERRDDVPKPTIAKPRRLDLPEGRWVEIVGGYSHREQQFLGWWQRQVATLGTITDAEERERAEVDLNAYAATFLDLHIVNHNLTHPGTDEPLPASGWELFWEMPAEDSLRLMRAIVRPASMFDSPKAGPSSTTG